MDKVSSYLIQPEKVRCVQLANCCMSRTLRFIEHNIILSVMSQKHLNALFSFRERPSILVLGCMRIL